jgi:hypothetical protein
MNRQFAPATTINAELAEPAEKTGLFCGAVSALNVMPFGGVS